MLATSTLHTILFDFGRFWARVAVACSVSVAVCSPAEASNRLPQSPGDPIPQEARTSVHWEPVDNGYPSLPKEVLLHFERHFRSIEVRIHGPNVGSVATLDWDVLCDPVSGLGDTPRREMVNPQKVFLSDAKGRFLAFVDEELTEPMPLEEIPFRWVRTGNLDLQTTFDPICLSNTRAYPSVRNPDLDGVGRGPHGYEWFCTVRHHQYQIDPYRWIIPGTYRMQLESRFHLPQEIGLTIEGGKTQVVKAHLKNPEGITAHGRVTLPPGRHFDEIEFLTVDLLSSFAFRARIRQRTQRPGRVGMAFCNTGEPRTRSIDWSMNKGRWVGRFEIPNVPIGKHRLFANAWVWNVSSNYSVQHDGSVAIMIDLSQQTSGPGWGFDLVLAQDTALPDYSPYYSGSRKLYRWNPDGSADLLLEFNGSHGLVSGQGVPLPGKWVLQIPGHVPVYLSFPHIALTISPNFEIALGALPVDVDRLPIGAARYFEQTEDLQLNSR